MSKKHHTLRPPPGSDTTSCTSPVVSRTQPPATSCDPGLVGPGFTPVDACKTARGPLFSSCPPSSKLFLPTRNSKEPKITASFLWGRKVSASAMILIRSGVNYMTGHMARRRGIPNRLTSTHSGAFRGVQGRWLEIALKSGVDSTEMTNAGTRVLAGAAKHHVKIVRPRHGRRIGKSKKGK